MNWLTALGICVAAAAFEGLCAGKDPLGELRKLRQPSWSPPGWVWVLIGIAWYGICFAGLVRLLPVFNAQPSPTLLLVALLFANGAVNVLQFRMRRLDLVLAFYAPYAALLVALLVAAWPLDRVTASLFLIYAAYQLYAAAWGYSLWRLNRKGAAE